MSRSDDYLSATAAVSTRDATGELACRRSLRGSRARRAAAALRRRRVLRSRGSTLMATMGLLMLSAGAAANTGGAVAGEAVSKKTIAAVQASLGIKSDGVIGPLTRRTLRRFQASHGLKRDGLLGPQTLRALGIDPDNLRVSSASRDERLLQIASCESEGDPRAVSADGRYYGKYQFSHKTWRSVGGRGNPAKASELEQDRRAAVLLARDGTAPWPNCA
ncbi:MAG: transglycosylase family protein [Solirubrobacteraceae bacterium]